MKGLAAQSKTGKNKIKKKDDSKPRYVSKKDRVETASDSE
jgi:hypothetical protein